MEPYVDLSSAGETVMQNTTGEILLNLGTTLKRYPNNALPNMTHLLAAAKDYNMDMSSPWSQLRLIQKSLSSNNPEYRFYAATNFGLVITKIEMFCTISRDLTNFRGKRHEFNELKRKKFS